MYLSSVCVLTTPSAPQTTEPCFGTHGELKTTMQCGYIYEAFAAKLELDAYRKPLVSVTLF